jgi:hypothetical protein
LASPLTGVIGLVGTACGVLSRAVAARATGGRAWPDALGHPASIALFGWLLGRSYRRRRQIRWKDRPVLVVPSDAVGRL